MSYKSSTRKSITLPSGAKTVIRKFTGYDFISEDFIPVVVTNPSGDSALSDPQSDQALQRAGLKMRNTTLLKCCGPITDTNGRVYSIVNKPFSDCAENEISLDEVPKDDANAIIHAVGEFSSLGKVAQDAATPFPTESTQGGNGASGGEALRSPANGAPSAAAI